MEMSPLPATHMGGLRAGGPTPTTESLDMGKCHLRLSWGTLIYVPRDTKLCPGGHQALNWGTLSLVPSMGWETPPQTPTQTTSNPKNREKPPINHP